MLLGIAAASGLTFTLILEPPWVWAAMVVFSAAMGLGAELRALSHPSLHHQHHYFSDISPFWVIPSMVTLSASLFLRLFLGGVWLIVGIFVAAALIALAVYGEQRSLDKAVTGRMAKTVMSLAAYLAAFGLYGAAFSLNMEPIPAALAVGLLSALLSLRLVWRDGAPWRRTWLYCALVGLILAETRWVLDYGSLGGAVGGVFLLLVFYTLAGIVQAQGAGSPGRGVWVEYGVVGLIGAALLFGAQLWWG